MKTEKAYIPERNDLIWLDFEPTRGKEIGKYRPAFVLSSKDYNKKTSMLICCPVSTSIRGAATEVPIKNLDEKSVVATNLIQTLSWKERKAKFITKAQKGIFEEVILRIIPLIGADEVLDKYMDEDS
ncbi:type II toxin-antitoxin system PemK/MazF family toxin [uncultured Endozoicomonas sp.]|uniref:type II toxin-antitoxin system PemK/MazF family toxin n=1 Tax=uncultured Endozoicomonas sp. TaxID=432652 RepID=UPI0026035373|nr:type II toxin-antitoxin system PemK/MazF family toxin [uncultured Endozoicomonas sp.]